MPKIKFRYNREAVTDAQAAAVGAHLENDLREIIRAMCPERSRHDYVVTIEGDPFGPIAYNQPDLYIEILYHDAWGFSSDGLRQMQQSMETSVSQRLRDAGAENAIPKVRFYSLAGYASRPT